MHNSNSREAAAAAATGVSGSSGKLARMPSACPVETHAGSYEGPKHDLRMPLTPNAFGVNRRVAVFS
jgi:hypothetical protein